MGKWKAAVSVKQRVRKKRYWRMMGWVARKVEKGGLLDWPGRGWGLDWWAEGETRLELPEVVLLDVKLRGAGDKGGVSDCARDDGDGEVAFSIRAHVR